MNLAINARDAMDEPRAADDRHRVRGRRLGAAGRHRHRLGHGRPHAGADLRALLHHQGGGQGHGPRALDGVRDRAPERRADRGREPPAGRHDVRDLAAAQRGRADPRRCARSRRSSRAAARGRCWSSRTTSRSAISCGCVLEPAGYEVPLAAGGEEALRLADPDVLITDILMPGMNGRELADRVLARAPAHARAVHLGLRGRGRRSSTTARASSRSRSRRASCWSRCRRCSNPRISGVDDRTWRLDGVGPPHVPRRRMPSFLDLPERTAKPRRAGITHVMDRGLSPLALESLLVTAGEHIDMIKLGWGTAYVTGAVPDKVAICRDAGDRRLPGRDAARDRRPPGASSTATSSGCASSASTTSRSPTARCRWRARARRS